MNRMALGGILVVLAAPAVTGIVATALLGGDANAWGMLLRAPGLTESVVLTLWTGIASTLLALGLAHLIVAFAGIGAWSDRIRHLAAPFIAVPHLALGIGIALLIAPSGLMLRLFSPWATGFQQPPDWLLVHDPNGLSLILGLVTKEAPFLVLVLAAARAQVPASRLLVECRTLGYRRLKGWLIAVAPLLQRQIRLPVAAVLTYSMTNVDMAIPLGPVTPPTLAMVLWQWFTASRLELRGPAYAGSVLLSLLVVGVMLLGVAASLAWGRVFRRFATSGQRPAEGLLLRGSLIAITGLVGFIGMGAVFAALARAVSPMWRFPRIVSDSAVGITASDAMASLRSGLPLTLVIGLLTALTVVSLSLVLAERLAQDPGGRRQVGALLFLPLLVPQIAWLFGFQWLLVRCDLDGTLIAVVWTHVAFAMPYAWGLLSAARAAIDPRFLTVAATLGAGPARRWRTVTLPLLSRAVLTATAISFAVSAALYLPTLYAGAGRIVTVATQAASAAASGNLRTAAINGATLALAPLLILVAASVASRAIFLNRRDVPR